jgi:hypothetical protein
MVGNVNTSSALSAFEKMEEKGMEVVQLEILYDFNEAHFCLST